MLYSDSPILKPSQDVLGRGGFALELARAIDNLTVARDGFVISILGEWGSGKTSVIELVVRYLRHIEMERASQAAILNEPEPRPKTIAELEAMSEAFEQIADRIKAMEAGQKNLTYWERINRIDQFRRWLDSEQSAEIADRYFQLKLNVEASPRTIVVRFSPWLIAGRVELAQALMSELARALGETLGHDVKQAFAAVLQRLAEFAPVGGIALELLTTSSIGKLLVTSGAWSGKIASTMASGPTLDQLRERLRAALRTLKGRRVLVLVDDLDRLTPPEALEMVSLVKSLGDLPNVIYLLTYEEAKLAELLEEATGVDGGNFLEKIVQYSVHLPLIESEDLVRLLNVDLSALLSDLSDEERRRLGTTWYHVFRHYLTTPRHVRRFVNAVSVGLSALEDYVDRIDFVLITLLQLYEPNVYWWVRRNLDDITE
jgi:predicted KAP-like P-loop ATPase